MLAKVLYTLRQRFSHLYLLHLNLHGTNFRSVLNLRDLFLPTLNVIFSLSFKVHIYKHWEFYIFVIFNTSSDEMQYIFSEKNSILAFFLKWKTGTNFEHAFIVCANSYTARS